MKRSLSIFLLLSSTIILFSFIDKKKKQEPNKAGIRTIIIDAGHGGIDQGAKGAISTEADVALAVSMKLGQAIQREFPDIKVVYTRTTDVMPGGGSRDEGLRYRADLANKSGGDLFIALHCNAAPPIRHSEFTGYKMATVYVGRGKKRHKVTRKTKTYRYWYTPNPANGTETYVWAVSKHGAKVNSISQNNDYYGEIDSTSTITIPDPDDPVEKIRMLVYEQNYFRKSLVLADLVEQGFRSQGRTYRGGVKQRNDKGIWVLQATGMPSVLVEMGFITDRDEEQYLNSDKGQDEISSNILEAIKAYKQKVESKTVGSPG